MDPRLFWLLVLAGVWFAVRWLTRPRVRTIPVRASRRSRHSTDSRPRVRPVLKKRPRTPSRNPPGELVTRQPHNFAYFGPRRGQWWDFSQDTQTERLAALKLPVLSTPDDLANWLGVSLGELAWLSHRCTRGTPIGVRQSHYVPIWKPKSSGGLRLIESPKPRLKALQEKILRELLNRVPASAAAHGFVRGRSIVTNAQPHIGAAVVLKFDLSDFYLTVRRGMVARAFRRLGYSREVSLWLMRLTTSAIPSNLPPPAGDRYAVWRYMYRHLPQGAPTSPALANLAARRLDQRLAGLARKFGATYTRYADDLTFSGDDAFSRRLTVFIPLVDKVIRDERFRPNPAKRQVLRRHQRQIVAGVVVNDRIGCSRRDFDQLKAVLHLCLTRGPSTQNRDRHPHFAEHLRGRIAHLQRLNPQRGTKLAQMFARIDWRK